MKNKSFKNRYLLLDEIRGFAVICMVFFHAFYTCFDVFGLDFAGKLITFFSPAEPFFAAGFVFISGMCGMFSKNPWKRTVILMGVACGLSAVTFFITKNFEFNCFVVFGIIHLLAVSWLLLSALKPVLLKIAPLLGLIINTLWPPRFSMSSTDTSALPGLNMLCPSRFIRAISFGYWAFQASHLRRPIIFRFCRGCLYSLLGFSFAECLKTGCPGFSEKIPFRHFPSWAGTPS